MGYYKNYYISAAAALITFAMCSCSSPADTQVDIPVDTTAAVTTESIRETEGETTISITEPEETIHIIETTTTETVPEATTPSASVEVSPEIDPEELEMLACVIYQEAGGDACCDDCRRRVADVVLNRVADPRFPDTMYKVLTAEGQYGRFYWTGIVWPKRAKYAGEAEAVKRAYRIAEEVLRGEHSELYGEGYIWQAEFKQGKDIIYCCGHYFGR